MDTQSKGSDVTDEAAPHRSRSADRLAERSDEYPRRGGIDVFDSLLVRQPIREGQTEAVRNLLATWARDHAEGDVRTLLPVEGVSLATLFLDTGDFGWRDEASAGTGQDGDALLWYVEVSDDGADVWATPDATIRSASPLFEAGLAEHLDASATVHVDGSEGHRLITHATNPFRRDRYADAVGSSLVAPAAGEELPIPVLVTTIPLKPGLTSSVVAQVVDFGNWLKGFDRVSEWLRDQTETLEDEAMYTESLLLEPVGDRLVLHYYMEAEEIDRLWDAFEGSDNWDVRFSKWAMRRIFEEPGAFLELPFESACEVLLHAVDPDRP